MDCPRCGTPLWTTDRQGVQVDHCSRCRGVWLDRGELDKLIARSAAGFDGDSDWGDEKRGDHQPPPGYGPPAAGYGPPPGGYPPKKREGFLGRLFDFD